MVKSCENCNWYINGRIALPLSPIEIDVTGQCTCEPPKIVVGVKGQIYVIYTPVDKDGLCRNHTPT